MTKETIVALANAEVGYREKASNSNLDNKTANIGSRNFTKYARDLDAIHWFNGAKNGYDWCAVFVSWLFYMGANKNMANAKAACYQPTNSAVNYAAGCKYAYDYYKNNKAITNKPQAGDQIFFSWKKGEYSHTGIVEKVDNLNVYTIEGNSGDGVNKKMYALTDSRIIGYGRPKYDATVVAPKPQAPAKKSVTEIAKEVIDGKWGVGTTRKQKLSQAGYDAGAVQNEVNAILAGKKATPAPAKKSIDEIAREVIAGKWGNGATRKQKLTQAGYDVNAVQKRINQLL